MQVKNTRYNYEPIRRFKIKQPKMSDNTKCIKNVKQQELSFINSDNAK